MGTTADPRRDSAELRKKRFAQTGDIRRQLARAFVRVNKLRIIHVKNGVQIVGTVEKNYQQMRLEGFSALGDGNAFAPVNAKFLRTLDLTIRDATDVKSVDWKLDGWLYAGGEFLPLG